ncbi:hypothetical protein C1H46_036626 [Malus baccata]|uniref:Uncharacterized protein n=1 Tax=Malus baccata TaxID=106549 RepID=A0A540KUG6_MALBA|nr:hypothetical protein C1H46_036626 [Malus baccata]
MDKAKAFEHRLCVLSNFDFRQTTTVLLELISQCTSIRVLQNQVVELLAVFDGVIVTESSYDMRTRTDLVKDLLLVLERTRIA